MAIADNLTTAEGILMDTYVRDLILVDKVAAIPTANKINVSVPITISTSNVIAAFSAMVVQLDIQNATDDRVLFISPATAGVYFQSGLLVNTDDGLSQIQKGYLATYRGVKIIQTNALTASNEMIMMQVGSVNVVSERYALETRDGVDGKYFNLIQELVYGGNIFTTNLVNVVINYCV